MSGGRHLPSLNGLRAFDAAARNLSFTRAAAELSVTQGAISRQVAHLENELSVRLFSRHRRAVSLTTEGQVYFTAIRKAFDQIHDATVRYDRAAEDHILRIKVGPTFAIRWLLPRLLRFHNQHPKINLQINTSQEFPDFDHEQVDVSIVSGVGAWPRWHADRLVGEVLLPVCSPKLLRGLRPICEPADLAHQVLLHNMQRPEDWGLWLEAARLTSVDTHGGLQLANSALMYQAAVEKLGVAIAQIALVEDDLAAGRLVAPFSIAVSTEQAYYLVFPRDRLSTPKIAAYRNWLLDDVKRHPGRRAIGLRRMQGLLQT